MPSLPTPIAWLPVFWLLSGGPAQAEAPPPPPEVAGPPLVADSATQRDRNPDAQCTKPGSDTNAWIDKVQRGLYSGVCGTALWFDGLFGNPRYDLDTDDTFGRLGLFENYDDRDGFDTKIRLRARYSFPNLKQRLRLTLGRGDEQTLVEERPADGQSPAPSSFQTVEDDAWLLGLGYSKNSGLENGFDFGAGVRLNTPIDPYVKATYRHNFVYGGKTLLRFRETPFWRDSRGWGATTQLSLDYLATDHLLFRWNNIGTVAQDTEALEWGTDVTLYQSLRERRAVSYTALLRGETGADVPIQNYGVETRYRQNMFRKWLFVELAASLTWPREYLEEERKINPGVGIGFEMYFGPTPDVELR
ncbi:MAG: hypothetical protein ABIX37_12530 [Gammaproteobacteria bacterium]